MKIKDNFHIFPFTRPSLHLKYMSQELIHLKYSLSKPVVFSLIFAIRVFFQCFQKSAFVHSSILRVVIARKVYFGERRKQEARSQN